MAMEGLEPVLRGMQAKLAAALPTEIASLNGTVPDDTYLLPDLADTTTQVLDRAPPLEDINVFPTFGVFAGHERWEDDTGFESTGVYELGVVVCHQHATSEALAHQLVRYVLAVKRVAMADRNIDHPDNTGTYAAWGTRLLRVNYGPMVGEQPNQSEPPASWMSWAAVHLEAKADEV